MHDTVMLIVSFIAITLSVLSVVMTWVGVRRTKRNTVSAMASAAEAEKANRRVELYQKNIEETLARIRALRGR